GVQIAFRNFTPAGGITGSKWVGLKHFIRFFESPQFTTLVKNTLSINLLTLLLFPVPIILALMINYCVSKRYAKVLQMVTYVPHFISVVIIVAMLNVFFSESIGVVNVIAKAMGNEVTPYLSEPSYFKYLFSLSGMWQTMGWSSILYIGALAGVSPELHEAAIVDGASKWKRIWNVDLPSILPTIVIMLVMSFGQIMSLGFQKVYLMQNAINLSASEVISTYVYKAGMIQNNFSYSTAVDLFNTMVNIIMLVTANYVVKRFTKYSLF
ncbi:MAG: sugar ABC transporter permease, partial [Oscillospiraceae bacterium]|nr:sugar ABC transporter permease [Oscillospiraceae bacterium]